MRGELLGFYKMVEDYNAEKVRLIDERVNKLLDGETKQKVVPELMPRALFWFRWGAAWTWITGLALLFVLYYVGPYGGKGEPLDAGVWGQALGLLIVGFVVYDQLSKALAGKLWVNLLAWGAVVTACCYYLETLQIAGLTHPETVGSAPLKY